MSSKASSSRAKTTSKKGKSAKKVETKKTTIVQKVILPSLIYSVMEDLNTAPKKIESGFVWKKLATMDAKSTETLKYQAPFTISADLNLALDLIQDEMLAQLRLLGDVATFPTGITALNRELKEISNATIISDICNSKPVDVATFPNVRKFEDKKKGIASMINVDGIFTKNSASKLVPVLADRYLSLLGHIAIHMAKMIMTSAKKYTLTARHLWIALYEHGISEDTLDSITDLITDTETAAEAKSKKKKKTKSAAEGDAEADESEDSGEPGFEVDPNDPEVEA